MTFDTREALSNGRQSPTQQLRSTILIRRLTGELIPGNMTPNPPRRSTGDEMTRWIWLLAVIVLIAGCARDSVEGGQPVRGETGAAEAYLAYEHQVDVVVDGDPRVFERIETVRSACVEGTFGPCSVLRIAESSGRDSHASLSLRLAPQAVEPMVALAAETGRVGARRTTAEDLSSAVADTRQKLAQFHGQRARLLELQSREGLTVSDHIALNRELSSIDTQIEALDGAAENQRYRLETNRLTLDFRAGGRDSAWGRLRHALADFGDTLADGIVDTLEWLAYGLPLLVTAFPLALLWRWLWRRATRSRRGNAD